MWSDLLLQKWWYRPHIRGRPNLTVNSDSTAEDNSKQFQRTSPGVPRLLTLKEEIIASSRVFTD